MHAPAPVHAPAPRAPAPHRFAPSHSSSDTFDVNMKIASLLSQHHAANPTPAPAPRAPPRPAAPRQPQFAPVHHAAPRQPQFAPQQAPTFAVPDNFASQQSFGRPSAAAPARQHPVDLSIPTTNDQGLLINPERFPGPLADTVPAGVGGRVQHVQFTPEVAAAHKNLADAHAQILSLQSNLRV